MRERERRLGKSLRGIVLSLLATPLAGTAGCHSDADGPDDASVRDSSLPPTDDSGSGPAVDASTLPTPDATVIDTGPPAPALDAAACAPITITDANYDDAPDGCSFYHYLPCGLPADASVLACGIDLVTCYALFGSNPPYLSCSLVNCSEAGIDPDAAVIADCTACNGITGRRPKGLCAPRPMRNASRSQRPATKTGDYFATMAHLESASVRAFRDLEKWLTVFCAPLRLTRAARRAAGDERRHARAAARMARRFGGDPPRPRVVPVTPPSLRALIEDDAVEGCVGEMFGALLATFQAEHATDPRIRRTLQRIALDETRHAALSWEILEWGATRLTAADRAHVRGALDGAVTALLRRPASQVDATTRRLAGHPTPREQRLLAQRLVELVTTEATRAS